MARVKAGDESSDLSDVPSETETRTNRRKVKKPSDEKPYVLLDDDDDDPDDDGQADQEDQGASSDSDEDFKLGARSRKNGKKPARKRARASTGQPAKPRSLPPLPLPKLTTEADIALQKNRPPLESSSAIAASSETSSTSQSRPSETSSSPCPSVKRRAS